MARIYYSAPPNWGRGTIEKAGFYFTRLKNGNIIRAPYGKRTKRKKR